MNGAVAGPSNLESANSGHTPKPSARVRRDSARGTALVGPASPDLALDFTGTRSPGHANAARSADFAPTAVSNADENTTPAFARSSRARAASTSPNNTGFTTKTPGQPAPIHLSKSMSPINDSSSATGVG